MLYLLHLQLCRILALIYFVCIVSHRIHAKPLVCSTLQCKNSKSKSINLAWKKFGLSIWWSEIEKRRSMVFSGTQTYWKRHRWVFTIKHNVYIYIFNDMYILYTSGWNWIILITSKVFFMKDSCSFVIRQSVNYFRNKKKAFNRRVWTESFLIFI